MDLGAVPHRLEEEKSASEDAGPRRGVDYDVPFIRVDTWRCANKDAGPRRRVDYDVPHWLGRTPKGVNCDVPHWLGRRTNHHLQGCGNLPHSRPILKQGELKERGQYQRSTGGSGRYMLNDISIFYFLNIVGSIY